MLAAVPVLNIPLVYRRLKLLLSYIRSSYSAFLSFFNIFIANSSPSSAAVLQ